MLAIREARRLIEDAKPKWGALITNVVMYYYSTAAVFDCGCAKARLSWEVGIYYIRFNVCTLVHVLCACVLVKPE